MTNIDKLVNVTWNHEDSKDFNCVAVDAININNPRPIRQKLSQSQSPQFLPNPLPILLYQHVALFCLRTYTPCSSPDSAVAASGRIDNLFLLQEKSDGGGGCRVGGTGSVTGSDGVGLQWYNINNTYSITMETRYQQPSSSSSSSSSSSGSPISSKVKSSKSKKGNHAHGSGGGAPHGADDLLKESLKVRNQFVETLYSLPFSKFHITDVISLCPNLPYSQT